MPDDQGGYYSATANDCMSSIASQFGFFWETLWNHPKNQDLRKLRKNPNVLLENDQVWIPAKQLRQETKPVDALHSFQLKGVPTLFKIRFTDAGKPRANVPYVLTIDGKAFNGSTDGDGMIEVPIPPNAQDGTLVLGQGKEAKTYGFDLGALAPVSEPEGAIKRLLSLGYNRSADPEAGLPDALRSFQADNQLPVTGDLDAATQSKLSDVFGC
ncbi:MAG TPA: peptidoglycan-binding domain-containing protein [Bryobacteraceae bacterium]|nr:peptidoglycan-binding domain-containing protein [Bryobacteraceae bacterium]